ncbi:unnamed protein product [Trifolium pratense]|uniref:Uncharacterized protein n=1 Tax=Trifolium pratense TaxID=57577 RepID=A0ACB0LQX3_TRIPR|nr:unnamed protein product [Trifolium pratense]
MTLKIDIRKAFDTLEWGFRLKVLRQFNFSDIFCSLIDIIFHSAKLSALVNGKSVGYFSCVTGVRQRDPLSLLLFLFSRGGTIPFTYLGFPIFVGKPKVVYFQAIVENIKAKLATWKGTMLSIMGRGQLVKSIIQGHKNVVVCVSFWIHLTLQRSRPHHRYSAPCP